MRGSATVCLVVVALCAFTATAWGDETVELPPGTVVSRPSEPPMILSERRYLLTERGMDDALTALRNEERLEASLQACATELDVVVSERHAPSGGTWSAIKWGTYGAVVVGAFVLGASL